MRTPPPKSTQAGETRKPASRRRTTEVPPAMKEQHHRRARDERAEPDPSRPLPLRVAPEPSASDDVLVHEALHRIERGLEGVLELGQRHAVTGREDRVEEDLLVGRKEEVPRVAPCGSGTQSSARNTPWSSRAICRWPRTARSTSVAVTSTRLTFSSRIVPSIPGCTPGGGVNCTATVGSGPAHDDGYLLPTPGVSPGVSHAPARPSPCSKRAAP